MSEREDHGSRGVLPDDEELLLRFVDQTSELMTVVDVEGRLLYVNSVAERIFGAPRHELVGRLAFDFVHEDDRERTRRTFFRWVEEPEGAPFCIENAQVGASGEVRRFLWTVVPALEDGCVRWFTSSGRDVTEERHAEASLRAGEARLRALMTGSLDPLISIDPAGVILEASDSVEALFGYAPSELIGRNVSTLMPEPHRERHDGYLANYARTGVTNILNQTRTFQVVHKDGSMRWADLSVSRIDVSGCEEPVFLGSFRDVTSRIEAEEARRESERRLRAVFDQEFEFVGLLDREGVVIDVNRAALEAIGESHEDVIGTRFWETSWWARDPEARVRLRDAIERAAQGEFIRFESEFHTIGGSLRTVDFSLKPIRDDDGEVVMLIPEGRDITELKQAQRRETAMLKALATIGESAAVLAHEIKNPITAINLALRAVADQLGEGQAVIIEDLASRMQRLEKLMRRTLAFTKPLELRRSPVKVSDLLREARRTLLPEFEARRTAVELRPCEPEAWVDVDANLIEEVLTNLLRNALDAQGDRGRIRLTAVRDGETHVVLRVEDDGPGLTDSSEDTLFRPFYTTKAEGTGLGLAICRKVVEEHGGTIRAGKSELGGACFELRLGARYE